MQRARGHLLKVEEKGSDDSSSARNRIFYMALPPTAFVPAAKSIAEAARAQQGWRRVIFEKPFGKDTESSAELGREISALFAEDEVYRIDHYLGKEMVQNLMMTTCEHSSSARLQCFKACLHSSVARAASLLIEARWRKKN